MRNAIVVLQLEFSLISICEQRQSDAFRRAFLSSQLSYTLNMYRLDFPYTLQTHWKHPTAVSQVFALSSAMHYLLHLNHSHIK